MMDGDAIAIVPAAPETVRNRDVYNPYRQDSDFLYLTGFNEPDAVAVLIPGRAQGEFVLFCRERDKDKEIWDGWRAGQEGAIEQYGADDAFPIDDIDDILPGLLEHQQRVYYSMGRHQDFDAHLIDWINQLRKMIRTGSSAPHQFTDLEYLLHDMRLYKSPVELDLMRRAAAVTCVAHTRAMQSCRPGMHEYQVEAELLYEFRMANMVPAYPSIVGGGINGCILHYTENSCELKDGDLLLIDAGAECNGYAADVTRTFPVGGRFSKAQRELYDIVLESQLAAIDACQPGNHWNDPHSAAVEILTKGLVSVGLLDGDVAKHIRDGGYRKYYMHRTGHWLGLDVHDVGDYKVADEWRVLEPGMVLTIEPGLYMPPHGNEVAPVWQHIGIRIEDDVLITEDGHEVLTAGVIKDADEIEALMNSRD